MMSRNLNRIVAGAAGLSLVTIVACGPKRVNVDPSGWQIPDFSFLMEDFVPYDKTVSDALSSRSEAEKWLYSDPSRVWEAKGVVVSRGMLNYGNAVHIGGEDTPDAPTYKKAYLPSLVREYTIQTEREQIFAVVPYIYREGAIRYIQDDTPPHIFNVGDRVHVKFSGQFRTDHGIMYYMFKENHDQLIPMMQIHLYKILLRSP